MDTPRSHSTPASVTPLALKRRPLHKLDSGALCYLVGLALDDEQLRNIISWHVSTPPNCPGVRHAWAIQAALIEGHAFSDWFSQFLDTEYHAEIALFEPLRRPEQLANMWRQLHADGRSAGAWWALVTHPRATNDHLQRAGSDLHLMGHQTAREYAAQQQHIAACEAKIAVLQAELVQTRREANGLASLHARESARWIERLTEAQKQILRLRHANTESTETAAQAPSSAEHADQHAASTVASPVGALAPRCVLCVKHDSDGPCAFRDLCTHTAWLPCGARDRQLRDEIAQADVVVCDAEPTNQKAHALDLCRERGTPVLFLNQPFSADTAKLVETLRTAL
ncbi:MAG: hypothetical protein AAF499_05075 [Pseudomonadota bacterium]